MYYHPRRLLANEDRIFKQRQYEETLRLRRESIQEYEKLMRRAKFERLNEPRINDRSLAEKLEEINTQRETVLSERRKKLRDLLEGESNELEHEMKTLTMNLSERRAWLEAEERKMKMEKPKKSMDFAEKQLERVFRENFDDIRTHNTKVAVMKTEEIRKKQREELSRDKFQEKGNNQASFHNSKMDETDRHDSSQKEAIDILCDELNQARILREEERHAVEEDMRNMVTKWIEEEENLKEKQYQKRLRDIEETKELLACNGQCITEKLSQSQEENVYDPRMISMLEEREREEKMQEKLLKEEQKREAIVYAEQLQAAVRRKKADDAELEALIKEEVDGDFEKRFAASRDQEAIKTRENEDQYAFKMNDNNNQLSKKDLHEALKAQIRCKKAAELVVEEKKRVEVEGMKFTEKKYEEKMKPKLSLPYPEPWYGRKAVKWYE